MKGIQLSASLVTYAVVAVALVYFLFGTVPDLDAGFDDSTLEVIDAANLTPTTTTTQPAPPPVVDDEGDDVVMDAKTTTLQPEPEREEFPYETLPSQSASVRIGDKDYDFLPSDVKTLRPDIFNPGYFSAFDVLAHVAEVHGIDFEYHFDEDRNTHIIDSINRETDWWYRMSFSGGWSEHNVFRPDHYPWKDGAKLRFYREDQRRIDNIRQEWAEEVDRFRENNGKIIVPEVIIRGRTTRKNIKNVEVTAHDMRYDVFKDGVITALDVVMSLGDAGLIDYELKWYERIGSARTVKDYWVESINRDVAHGRCGFVYEAGSKCFDGFRGNHIHLPTDQRVINSPEYVEFFWICL